MSNTRSNIVEVGPNHPLWRSWDDDDWNGATCGNWIRSYAPGADIKLRPPPGCDPDLVMRVRDALQQIARSVEVVGHHVDGG